MNSGKVILVCIILADIINIPPDFAFLGLVVAQGEAEVNGRKLSLKI